MTNERSGVTSRSENCQTSRCIWRQASNSSSVSHWRIVNSGITASDFIILILLARSACVKSTQCQVQERLRKRRKKTEQTENHEDFPFVPSFSVFSVISGGAMASES